MKILLTGATGYIGKRLIPVLLYEGHEIVAVVRDRQRFNAEAFGSGKITVVEHDFLKDSPAAAFPEDIDAAYFLIHSMSASIEDFYELEARVAANFVKHIDRTRAQQIIYLSGLSNEAELSEHLSSRKNVETVLSNAKASLTVLRAGIIIGSGSASFEIMRDLVEKLPVMIAPQWLTTRCQPIAIRNVIEYLTGVLHNRNTYGKTFDIGGPEILTYKQMLLKFADVRQLRRKIISVPVMTPRLSSYWLYFVTATSYKLAVNLVDSMKIDVVCDDRRILDIVDVELIDYETAIRLAFEKIEQNHVISSWKDALDSGTLHRQLDNLIRVPQFGCFRDHKMVEVRSRPEQVLDNVWRIGGERGWYYANWLWEVRGFLDKLVGGVGLRRGRTNADTLNAGDALDFWRVIYASKPNRRLLLYAEMKLPGEAWLEFHIKSRDDKFYLEQTATFRPRGVWGRLYWYLTSPFHLFIFDGMIRNIERYENNGSAYKAA